VAIVASRVADLDCRSPASREEAHVSDSAVLDAPVTVDFEGNNNLLIVAVSLSVGLIPAVAPTFYEKFPSNFQVIFGSSITSTVIVVFVLNLAFNHWVNWPPKQGLLRTAPGSGAVAPADPPS
jgi:hypothetical protein